MKTGTNITWVNRGGGAYIMTINNKTHIDNRYNVDADLKQKDTTLLDQQRNLVQNKLEKVKVTG